MKTNELAALKRSISQVPCRTCGAYKVKVTDHMRGDAECTVCGSFHGYSALVISVPGRRPIIDIVWS